MPAACPLFKSHSKPSRLVKGVLYFLSAGDNPGRGRGDTEVQVGLQAVTCWPHTPLSLVFVFRGFSVVLNELAGTLILFPSDG